MADVLLTYVLFNDDWDEAVGNTLDQRLRPRAPWASGRGGLDKYLTYLGCSLRSFARFHGGSASRVQVLLAELSPRGLRPSALAALVARAAPTLKVDIAWAEHARVRPYLDEAREVDAACYRAPNRLHEALVLDAIERAEARHLAFADPDVVFTSPGALDHLVEHLVRRPEKWAAGFVEQPKRQPWSGGWMSSRPRLHSVLALFDAPALQRHLPFTLLRAPPASRTRLLALRDEEALAHYTRYPVFDTFSLLSEYLRGNFQIDRLLDLSGCVGRFVEGSMLTLVCEHFVHAKVLDPGGLESLSEALARAGLDGAGALLPELLASSGAPLP